MQQNSDQQRHNQIHGSIARSGGDTRLKKRERCEAMNADGVKQQRLEPDASSLVGKDGGLCNLASVEKLLYIMQHESVQSSVQMKTMLAKVMALTNESDCLSEFVKLGGLPVLDQWLQEAQRGFSSNESSVTDSEKASEELLITIVGALEKLPVDLEALLSCSVCKTVKSLRSHKHAELHRKAKKLVENWKRQVGAELKQTARPQGSCKDVDMESSKLVSRAKFVSMGSLCSSPSPSPSASNSSGQPQTKVNMFKSHVSGAYGHTVDPSYGSLRDKPLHSASRSSVLEPCTSPSCSSSQRSSENFFNYDGSNKVDLNAMSSGVYEPCSDEINIPSNVVAYDRAIKDNNGYQIKNSAIHRTDVDYSSPEHRSTQYSVEHHFSAAEYLHPPALSGITTEREQTSSTLSSPSAANSHLDTASPLETVSGVCLDKSSLKKNYTQERRAKSLPVLASPTGCREANGHSEIQFPDRVSSRTNSSSIEHTTTPATSSLNNEKSDHCSNPAVSILTTSPKSQTEKFAFDLNEGFNSENGDGRVASIAACSSSMPIMPCASAPTAPVAVVATAKSPFKLPELTSRPMTELGWKGSAATSAFRPTQPRRVGDKPKAETKPLVSFDLNVAADSPAIDETKMEAPVNSMDMFDLKTNVKVSEMYMRKPVWDLNQTDASIPTASEGIKPTEKPKSMMEFDLNDGPALDDNEHSAPSRLFQIRDNQIKNPSVSGVNILSASISANTMAATVPKDMSTVSMPKLAPSSLSMSYPIGGVQSWVNSTPGDTLFQQSVSTGNQSVVYPSSSSMTYPPTPAPSPYPYGAFPFGLSSTSIQGFSSPFLQSPQLSSLHTIPPPLAVYGSLIPSQIKPPYMMSMVADAIQQGGGNIWGCTNLDVNASNAGTDARNDARVKSVTTPSTIGPNQAAIRQTTVDIMAALRHQKEQEGCWDMQRILKQPVWQ